MKRFLSLFLALTLFACCTFASAAINPIVEVHDDDAFEDALDIEVDVDDLFEKAPEMSIISDKIGQIAFATENPDGDAVRWTLRFTRDEAFDGDVELFAGVYADDFVASDPFDYTYTDSDDDDDDDDDTITFPVTQMTSEGENTAVYFWNHRGTYYALTVAGNPSNMQFAEVFDSVMDVCFD
ncbi:MAG: hypothetical protein ACOYI8_09110 [Christensenellales bacterium]|jgi:hypothetical protein